MTHGNTKLNTDKVVITVQRQSNLLHNRFLVFTQFIHQQMHIYSNFY